MKLNGPGKYDPETTAARLSTEAIGVALLVFGGRHGDGFSVQVPAEILFRLPAFLRDMADRIERQQTES